MCRAIVERVLALLCNAQLERWCFALCILLLAGRGGIVSEVAGSGWARVSGPMQR